MNKELRKILENQAGIRKDCKSRIPIDQAISRIKALWIKELTEKLTPLLLKNRPGNELHWGIYVGKFDDKSKAIDELKKKWK